MKKAMACIVLFAVADKAAFSQKDNGEAVRTGNAYYKQQQYELAAKEYNNALALNPQDTTAKFNLASAVYRQNKQEDARKLFGGLAKEQGATALSAKAYYNKGVIESRQKNLEESILSYKQALRNDPADKQARENLQKALLELKKKRPPKKQEKKENKQQQQKQPQSKMNPKQVEKQLQNLAQKEKQVQQRIEKEKTKTGTGAAKDW